MVSEWNKAGKTKWVQLETRQLRKTGESSFILFFTAPASGDLVFKLLCMWGAAHITALVTCIRQRTRKCVFCFQWRKLYRNIFQFHLFCLYFDIKDKLELESYLIWSHATIFLIVSLEIFSCCHMEPLKLVQQIEHGILLQYLLRIFYCIFFLLHILRGD